MTGRSSLAGRHGQPPLRGGHATVASLQTPPGRGGIAVIRLVGPGAGDILASIFRPLPSHRRGGGDVLQLGHLLRDGQVIDEAVVCLAKDSAEINIHGGPHVVRTVLEVLAARGAEIAAEPVAEDLPPAHPKWNNPAVGRELLAALPQARSALVVAVLSRQWSAGISELARSQRPTATALREAASGLEVCRQLLNPPEVVLAGPPNAGKSALTNALVGRTVSIVHEQAGTTRDWVRELALLEGVPVWLTDTAGIWRAPEGVDAEAVRRARRCVEQADLVLLLRCGDGGDAPAWLTGRRLLRVGSQCDRAAPPAGCDAAVSAVTGEGLAALKSAALAALGLSGIDPAVARAFTPRQARMLHEAAEALDRGDGTKAREALEALLGG